MENNNSMKSQKDRILVWQEEVKNVFAANKQQFKEAKEIIESVSFIILFMNDRK